MVVVAPVSSLTRTTRIAPAMSIAASWTWRPTPLVSTVLSWHIAINIIRRWLADIALPSIIAIIRAITVTTAGKTPDAFREWPRWTYERCLEGIASGSTPSGLSRNKCQFDGLVVGICTIELPYSALRILYIGVHDIRNSTAAVLTVVEEVDFVDGPNTIKEFLQIIRSKVEKNDS
jgi:hypothetical protein